MWTHTTLTVKVARLIHKSWLVFYYHSPQPKTHSLKSVQIKISFCLKTIQSLSFFTRKRRNVDTHTTPTVKVARLIHKSWLVFYYHHPQPKKCSLDRVCKRAHNLCFFSVSIPRISNLEKSNATKKGK